MPISPHQYFEIRSCKHFFECPCFYIVFSEAFLQSKTQEPSHQVKGFYYNILSCLLHTVFGKPEPFPIHSDIFALDSLPRPYPPEVISVFKHQLYIPIGNSDFEFIQHLTARNIHCLSFTTKYFLRSIESIDYSMRSDPRPVKWLFRLSPEMQQAGLNSLLLFILNCITRIIQEPEAS